MSLFFPLLSPTSLFKQTGSQSHPRISLPLYLFSSSTFFQRYSILFSFVCSVLLCSHLLCLSYPTTFFLPIRPLIYFFLFLLFLHLFLLLFFCSFVLLFSHISSHIHPSCITIYPSPSFLPSRSSLPFYLPFVSLIYHHCLIFFHRSCIHLVVDLIVYRIIIFCFKFIYSIPYIHIHIHIYIYIYIYNYILYLISYTIYLFIIIIITINR